MKIFMLKIFWPQGVSTLLRLVCVLCILFFALNWTHKINAGPQTQSVTCTIYQNIFFACAYSWMWFRAFWFVVWLSVLAQSRFTLFQMFCLHQITHANEIKYFKPDILHAQCQDICLLHVCLLRSCLKFWFVMFCLVFAVSFTLHFFFFFC